MEESESDGDEGEMTVDLQEQKSTSEGGKWAAGDLVRASRLLGDGVHGIEETLILREESDQGWEVERLDIAKATVRLERRGDELGWIVRQPGRKQVSKWFGVRRWGEEAEVQARQCKKEWDQEASCGMLTENGPDNGNPRYSLIGARKCGELEAEALRSDRFDVQEGKSERKRREAVAKYTKSHREERGEDKEDSMVGASYGPSAGPSA